MTHPIPKDVFAHSLPSAVSALRVRFSGVSPVLFLCSVQTRSRQEKSKGKEEGAKIKEKRGKEEEERGENHSKAKTGG